MQDTGKLMPITRTMSITVSNKACNVYQAYDANG
jgi:hypothetical protein